MNKINFIFFLMTIIIVIIIIDTKNKKCKDIIKFINNKYGCLVDNINIFEKIKIKKKLF